MLSKDALFGRRSESLFVDVMYQSLRDFYDVDCVESNTAAKAAHHPPPPDPPTHPHSLTLVRPPPPPPHLLLLNHRNNTAEIDRVMKKVDEGVDSV